MFIGTSVAIGIVAVSGTTFAIVSIVLGLLGGALLLYASALLVSESRFALAALNAEMDFVRKLGKELGPEDLVQKGPVRSHIFGRPR